MPTLNIGTLHRGQAAVFNMTVDPRVRDLSYSREERRAWALNSGGRFKVGRCGRRWGKTKYGLTWGSSGAIKGELFGWFAPAYKYILPVYEQACGLLAPVVKKSNKTDMTIHLKTGGQVEFWTLEDPRAGRSRKYHKVVIDEAAYTKGNALEIWQQAIEPTLLDYSGSALAISNTLGNDPENLLWQLCNNPKHGFIQFHATSLDNPLVPLRRPGETAEAHAVRRVRAFDEIRRTRDPLVFQQEYLAEFVDWSGRAFFSHGSLTVGEGPGGAPPGLPVREPARCDGVFAVMDTATKTGKANDATGVTFFAVSAHNKTNPVVILDWDVRQIEGGSLDGWLPTIQELGEDWARRCGARNGFLGTFIEDKDSGQVLLQKARAKRMRVHTIKAELTALGKDERALSVSGHVYTGKIKFGEQAYHKVMTLKGSTRNHLLAQVTSFRLGDPKAASRADDLLDTFTYGVALALGNEKGL